MNLDTLFCNRLAVLLSMCKKMDNQSIAEIQKLSRTFVIDGLKREQFPRLTLDFDGSVLSTKGHAEGSAIGFNKTKKGSRSYYPLFCTVAQTGQFFDMHHRPGNVHDSNGTADFMVDCFQNTKSHPSTILESRTEFRFVFTRKKVKKTQKGALLLDLFEPIARDYQYNVIVTNKTESAKAVVLFHNGRGSQESIFGDAKNSSLKTREFQFKFFATFG